MAGLGAPGDGAPSPGVPPPWVITVVPRLEENWCRVATIVTGSFQFEIQILSLLFGLNCLHGRGHPE